MTRPPRSAEEPLFGSGQIALAGVQGLVLLASIFGLYFWLNGAGAGEGEARAVAFVALVSGHLSLAAASLASRSGARGGPHWLIFLAIAGGAAMLMAAMLNLPLLLEIMRFSAPSAADVATGLGVGLLAGGWYSGRLLLAARIAAEAAPGLGSAPSPAGAPGHCV